MGGVNSSSEKEQFLKPLCTLLCLPILRSSGKSWGEQEQIHIPDPSAPPQKPRFSGSPDHFSDPHL